jgi:hypothetical protein
MSEQNSAIARLIIHAITCPDPLCPTKLLIMMGGETRLQEEAKLQEFGNKAEEPAKEDVDIRKTSDSIPVTKVPVVATPGVGLKPSEEKKVEQTFQGRNGKPVILVVETDRDYFERFGMKPGQKVLTDNGAGTVAGYDEKREILWFSLDIDRGKVSYWDGTGDKERLKISHIKLFDENANN